MMMEADDAVRVKVVEYRRSKATARLPNAGQMDFDVEVRPFSQGFQHELTTVCQRPKRHEENEQERKQMMSWAKNQSGSRRQGTGRSGNSTAVTGHTKAKTGGGSLRSTQPKNAATVSEAHKPNTPSLLATVSNNRRGKFA